MERRPPAVKATVENKRENKRTYDGRHRRARALENRDRIVDVALRRFVRDGYAATTIASIAEDAGVSADTIYKSFGGKHGLVLAVRERALQGTGPVPAEARSDALHAASADPRQIVEGWA